jgi:glutamyl-Q tRNA(Asp) synthetase
MHLGHAYSAMLAYDISQENEGDFHLRIEDLDQSRAKIHWEEQIYEDLSWLGIKWNKTVLRQSERLDLYFTEMLRKAENFGLFICRCSRGDIASITSAPHGADGLVYPGTCRNGKHSFSTEMRKNPDLLQSNIRMHPMLDKTFFNFQENIFRKSKPTFTFSEFKKSIGDVVLWRRGYAAYHLASVIDDAHQGVTDVIRGEDLFEATKIHVVIQNVLDLPTPKYHHHRLILDEAGHRLAKRSDAQSIKTYRALGYTPEDIRELLGLV